MDFCRRGELSRTTSANSSLVERYADRIVGVLSCYDRVIVRGGVRGFDYARAMECYGSQHYRRR